MQLARLSNGTVGNVSRFGRAGALRAHRLQLVGPCPALRHVRRLHSHQRTHYARRVRQQRCKPVAAQQTSGGAAVPARGSVGLVERLAQASTLLPYAVLASAVLSLIRPASFAWFNASYFAPALGFLMFCVGINTKVEQFQQVAREPQNIAVGVACQWLVKPALGVLVATTLVPALRLPQAISTGLILVSCVSGAQLASYATFLAHPEQAPLSIVLVALSTAMGVAVTPLLALALLGARLPVDAAGMAVSIFQIVVAPVTAGLLCNTFALRAVDAVRPVLPVLSLVDTCCCVGASLTGAAAARSPIAAQVLLPVVMFHALAFWIGRQLAANTIAKGQAGVPLARAISLQTGMQSSLLALLLATRYFSDPLVRLPCGLSVVVMTLAGFGLVLLWGRDTQSADEDILQTEMQ